MVRKVLAYKDFRPARKGDKGYSSGKRRMISDSTKEDISRREFVKRAGGTVTPKGKQAISTPATTTTVAPKMRKTRVDKGMTRQDYNERKHREKVKRDLQKAMERDRQARYERITKKRTSKQEDYTARFERAVQVWNTKHNLRAGTTPESDLFYDAYDVITHPDNYDTDDFISTYDYFFHDDESNYDYDYPAGETP